MEDKYDALSSQHFLTQDDLADLVVAFRRTPPPPVYSFTEGPI